MNIEQLNTEYAIADIVKFVEGKGGFPVIEVRNQQAIAKISVYAGQVLSFQPIGATADLLFVSSNAYFQSGKAIKGGIPVCWPWFGADPENQGRGSHGFVRDRPWTVLATAAPSANETKITLGLSDTAETRELWPHAFELRLELTIDRTLRVELVTHNTGDQSFSITQALHTYFTIGDVAQVSVLGLDGCDYLDKVEDFARQHQGGPITVSAEVDRIYLDVPNALTVEDAALARRIQISTAGNKTAIVWNPWIEVSQKMADLAADNYQKFICVETANAAEDVVTVAAGEEYRLVAEYAVEGM
ncbi:MAG: D-hexose-6-phosphate mutarotase [Leptolyngbya sp. SIO4C1]|nr:D-hexose-6-phosphate mutarotase [Leptolyngbya sp. SIO4C1]